MSPRPAADAPGVARERVEIEVSARGGLRRGRRGAAGAPTLARTTRLSLPRNNPGEGQARRGESFGAGVKTAETAATGATDDDRARSRRVEITVSRPA